MGSTQSVLTYLYRITVIFKYNVAKSYIMKCVSKIRNCEVVYTNRVFDVCIYWRFEDIALTLRSWSTLFQDTQSEKLVYSMEYRECLMKDYC